MFFGNQKLEVFDQKNIQTHKPADFNVKSKYVFLKSKHLKKVCCFLDYLLKVHYG